MPESVNGQEAVSLEQLKTLNDSYADRFIPYASSSAIANANDWLTTGYAKTSTSTTNLPAECTGTSMWGVLLFVAENAEMGTGTQQFFPIDGDQKGQMFVRSLTRLLATEPIIGEWHKLATESYVKDYVGQSGGGETSLDLTGVVKAYDSNFGDILIKVENGTEDVLNKIRVQNVKNMQDNYIQLDTGDLSESSGSSLKIISNGDAPASFQLQNANSSFNISINDTHTQINYDGNVINGVSNAILDSPIGDNLVTDKAVADYVAANAGGGGGLQLLWEGSSSSIVSVSGYTLTDYDFILIVFLTGGAYYVSACRPDGNTYMAHTTQTSVNISGSYANSVSVASPAVIRAIYGIKASEQ